jgi:uncharacterized protein YkwD
MLVLATVAGAERSVSSSNGSITVQRALESRIFARLNAVRAERGLQRLSLSPGLATAAARHSREMAASGRFQHASPNGGSAWLRLEHYFRPTGYRAWAVGETLYWSSPDTDAAAIVSDWLASPSHRSILLDPRWREVGVSAIHDSAAPRDFRGLEATIVTADFGARTR